MKINSTNNIQLRSNENSFKAIKNLASFKYLNAEQRVALEFAGGDLKDLARDCDIYIGHSNKLVELGKPTKSAIFFQIGMTINGEKQFIHDELVVTKNSLRDSLQRSVAKLKSDLKEMHAEGDSSQKLLLDKTRRALGIIA